MSNTHPWKSGTPENEDPPWLRIPPVKYPICLSLASTQAQRPPYHVAMLCYILEFTAEHIMCVPWHDVIISCAVTEHSSHSLTRLFSADYSTWREDKHQDETYRYLQLISMVWIMFYGEGSTPLGNDISSERGKCFSRVAYLSHSQHSLSEYWCILELRTTGKWGKLPTAL